MADAAGKTNDSHNESETVLSLPAASRKCTASEKEMSPPQKTNAACQERVPLLGGKAKTRVWQTTVVMIVMVKTMQVNPTALCPTSPLL